MCSRYTISHCSTLYHMLLLKRMFTSDEICVSELFAELKLFCDIFTVEWKHEEQRIAKEMFSKVERTRKVGLPTARGAATGGICTPNFNI